MKLYVFLVSVILFIQCTYCITDDPETTVDDFEVFTDNTNSENYPFTTSTEKETTDGYERKDKYDIIDLLVSVMNMKSDMIMNRVIALAIDLINSKYDVNMPNALKNISDLIYLHANGENITEDNPIQLDERISRIVVNFLDNLSDDLKYYYNVENTTNIEITLFYKKMYYGYLSEIAKFISMFFNM
ncbi:uncharacterized protein [Centruroides vittatus]|uniref:uncharacterized protein n=1 Tax=Centruroides vittatus TaxID=120091 RepID=UPI0035106F20